MAARRPRRVSPLRRAALAGLLLVSSWPPAAAQSAEPTCTLPVSPPPDQTRVVFLLDTSGSMVGQGDSVANIFAAVQGAILRGMRATTAPGTVEIDTFDRGPQQRASFLWPAERAEFERTVNGLEANGANTWLYRSMEALFGRLSPRAQVATTVYVVTDGRDNDPGGATIQSALDAFDLSRGPFDKLYYVALGTTVPQNVKQAFARTTFAQAIELPVGQAPDFTAVTLTPGLVTVGPTGSFPYRRPAGTTLELESGRIGDAAVTIRNPRGAGERVDLDIQGTVPAGSVGYMCAQLPDARQNVLLRFDQDTPRRPGSAAPLPPTLGSLVLLNPKLDRVLSRGEQAVLHYRAVGGPVTVEVATQPPELGARLPDQTVSLLEGERVDLTVTDRSLAGGQEAAPTLRLNDRTPMRVPSFVGEIRRPFPWWWLLLLLLPLLCLLFLLGRARRTFVPYALSVNRALVVFLHDRQGRRRRAVLRRDQTDIGAVFREEHLCGLVLERYRPEPQEEVVLDNSDMSSIRDYAGQRLRRAARLLAQPDTLRLHKHGREEGDFLQLQETLALGQLYVFTDYTPPRVRQRPAPPPPEPPIDVIVSLLDGPRMQELELPLDDVDLADVFGNEDLRGLVVRREPGLLRLRALRPEMRLRHISREFYPGEALPLAVMLDLRAGDPGKGTRAYQVRIRDKASLDRYRR